MTEQELLDNGWREVVLSNLIQYRKSINGFHYTLTYMPLEVYNTLYTTNWYDWQLYIDSPDFSTVASMEIDSLEHINLISKIYDYSKSTNERNAEKS